MMSHEIINNKLFLIVFIFQPSGYLAHLIGHEGPGSLLSELKRLGWSNSLAAGSDSGAKGYESFAVSVDLTEEGLGMYFFV